MKQYTFHYPKTSIHIVLLVVFGLFAAFLLYFAFRSLQKLPAATGADKTVFGLLGGSFGLLGLAFLGFGVFYFQRIRNFYKRNEWYGVQTDSRKISCRSFDFYSTHYFEFERTDPTTVKPGSNKGRRYLRVTTPGKEYTIPVNYLDAQSIHELIKDLEQKKLQ